MLLAVVLCAGPSVLPAAAQALPSESTAAGSVPACAVGGIEVFRGVTPLASSGQTELTGADLAIYNKLKEEIAKVAGGARDSSVFEINTAGMGISYANGTLRGVDLSAIVRALSADCPYELYWFDKITGFTANYRGSSRDHIVTSITFQFTVSQDYAVTDPGRNIYYPYQPDTKKTAAAAAVAQAAKALVDRSSTLSDYDKLTAYRDYICNQVSYNSTAANSINYPYGDPWQLIYVFDNDPSTNVVCEGYAKAFKYLCDLTSFSSSIDCYIVTGRASSDHMWNIVRIDGQSYLVDVTNSDTGGVGEYGGLFLAGAPGATGNGCTISIPQHDLGNGYYVQAANINYMYDAETKELYDPGILTLAGADYAAPAEPSAPVEPTAPVPAVPSFTDVPAWCSAAVDWAVEQKITNGYEDSTFRPAIPCTHAQILTFLWRAAGEPAPAGEAPVAVESYYQDGVNWAYGIGIVDDTSFVPDAPCTRADAVGYIWQCFGGPEAPAGSFADVDADASFAGAVNWAVANGLTNGFEDGSFRPDEVCSRGQIATLLHRAYVPEVRLDVNS